jgi:hypothetical protein
VSTPAPGKALVGLIALSAGDWPSALTPFVCTGGEIPEATLARVGIGVVAEPDREMPNGCLPAAETGRAPFTSF